MTTQQVLDEYPELFRGIGTPSVALGRGYCINTAHLGSWLCSRFARKPVNLPNYQGREGSELHYHVLVRLRHCGLVSQFHWSTLCGGCSDVGGQTSLNVTPVHRDGNIHFRCYRDGGAIEDRTFANRIFGCPGM